MELRITAPASHSIISPTREVSIVASIEKDESDDWRIVSVVTSPAAVGLTRDEQSAVNRAIGRELTRLDWAEKNQ